VRATISCQYYAQNVKVNLGYNFQIRWKVRGRKREREGERNKKLVSSKGETN
jgi:hypothetical protein